MRSMWAALALVHVMPLASVTATLVSPERTGGTIVSLLGLLATFVFFVLKACDLPALRWSISRGQMLCLVLGVALVHNDVSLDDGAGLMLSEAPAAMVIAAALEALRRSPGLRRRLADLFALPLPVALSASSVELQFAGVPSSRIRSGPLSPRAPPA